jgi:hypothetical protein
MANTASVLDGSGSRPWYRHCVPNKQDFAATTTSCESAAEPFAKSTKIRGKGRFGKGILLEECFWSYH